VPVAAAAVEVTVVATTGVTVLVTVERTGAACVVPDTSWATAPSRSPATGRGADAGAGVDAAVATLRPEDTGAAIADADGARLAVRAGAVRAGTERMPAPVRRACGTLTAGPDRVA
jgi:hypothetical protein